MNMSSFEASSLYNFLGTINSYDYDLNRVSSNAQKVVEYSQLMGSENFLGSQSPISTTLRTHSLLSNPNSAVHYTASQHYAIIDFILSLVNPSKIIIHDICESMSEFLLMKPESDYSFINSLELHYLESVLSKDLSNYSLITRSDINNDNYPYDFDAAILGMSCCGYEYEKNRNIYDHLNLEGVLIIHDTAHYQNYIYRARENSYLHLFYKDILTWPGVKVINLIEAFGICLVQKGV